jgi:hypothetical protein
MDLDPPRTGHEDRQIRDPTDQSVARIGVGDIQCVCFRRATLRADLRGHALGTGEVDVRRVDGRSCERQRPAHRGADPARSARDDGSLPVQIHGALHRVTSIATGAVSNRT